MSKAKPKRTRKEADEYFWKRYDLTTELCAMEPFCCWSINRVGAYAEKLLRMARG